MTQNRSHLIVLNGASSAGKTCIAQALISRLGAGCVHTGLDDLLARTRPFGPDSSGGFGQIVRGVRVAWFQVTDGRLRLFKTLHREAVARARAGQDVIVETALMDRRALLDAASCFAPLEGLFVGVKPPLAVSEQWEAGRGDRPHGQARKHYDLIHGHGVYDLVLDPSTASPEDCAAAILRRWEDRPPGAFGRLVRDASRLKNST
jgi:chloramphenicol 3-O phosphotransferase